MISDVLVETIETIDEYRRTLPDVYMPFSGELDELRVHVDRVRVLLDSPPNTRCAECLQKQERIDQLQNLLRSMAESIDKAEHLKTEAAVNGKG